MEVISAEILDGIREKCKILENYRVCIFCNDIPRARVIQEALACAWPETQTSITFTHDIRFPNTGGVVRILTNGDVVSGSARGNRFHEIYLDNEIYFADRDTLDYLERMIAPYWRFNHQPPVRNQDPCFHHLDTREPGWGWGATTVVGENIIADDIYVDPNDEMFENLRDIVAKFNINSDVADIISFKYEKAPDLGDFPPCQELNCFLESLF